MKFGVCFSPRSKYLSAFCGLLYIFNRLDRKCPLTWSWMRCWLKWIWFWLSYSSTHPAFGPFCPLARWVRPVSCLAQHVWTVELFKPSVSILCYLLLLLILVVLWFFWGNVLFLLKGILVGETLRHHTASVKCICFLVKYFFSSNAAADDLLKKGKYSMAVSVAWSRPTWIAASLLQNLQRTFLWDKFEGMWPQLKLLSSWKVYFMK